MLSPKIANKNYLKSNLSSFFVVKGFMQIRRSGVFELLLTFIPFPQLYRYSIKFVEVTGCRDN
jgi:hypothetical protein